MPWLAILQPVIILQDAREGLGIVISKCKEFQLVGNQTEVVKKITKQFLFSLPSYHLFDRRVASLSTPCFSCLESI